MKRVTGIGGVFFKANDVATLKNWYRDHLGFKTSDWGASFTWGETDPSTKSGRTEWSPFADTKYFEPSTLPYMFNYRVEDLHGLMALLKEEGVHIVGKIDEYDYGKFGWIMDPEGRKIELWEPIDSGLGDAPPLWTERVTGLGGVFFKTEDPKKMKEWYSRHLGVGDIFTWKDLSNPDSKTPAMTVWSPFKKDTDYFDPSDKPYMFNYRVKDLPKLIDQLKAEGVQVVGEIQNVSYGKFAWIVDPEGTKIELWDPIDDGF